MSIGKAELAAMTSRSALPHDMTPRPKLTKAQKEWGREISMLYEFSQHEGLKVELRNPDHPEYQIARLTADGVRLICYPHKTKGTGNRHARIRDENSSDKEKARKLMARLDAIAGFNCTFSHKWNNWHAMLREREELVKEGRIDD